MSRSTKGRIVRITRAEMAPGPDQHPSWRANGGTRKDAERLMLQE